MTETLVSEKTMLQRWVKTKKTGKKTTTRRQHASGVLGRSTGAPLLKRRRDASPKTWDKVCAYEAAGRILG